MRNEQQANEQQYANALTQSSVDSAANAVSVANTATKGIKGGIEAINQFTANSSNAAAGMGASITNVNAAADNVNNSAHALTPFITGLGAQGRQIYQQGLELYQQANPYLAAGRDILNLNTKAGGLTGEYLDSLLAVDPNRYVSMAAGDVQGAGKNVQGQMQREMSRMGVDAGSGRYQAQMQNFAQGLAAALAGAKTRARQIGVTEKLNAMQGAFGLGQQLGATGAGIAAQGVQAQTAGSGVIGQAAQTQAAQGQLQGQAGQLSAQAGQLGAAQAGAYAQAGQQALGAIDASLKAAGLKVNAQQLLSNAQQAAGLYYAQVAQGNAAAAAISVAQYNANRWQDRPVIPFGQ